MVSSNELRPSEISRRKKHRRRRVETTALGTAVILFAVIGIVYVIWKLTSVSVKYVKDYIGPAETTKFFESYISPVVMQDPEPFSDVKKLDQDWIVKTAIWAALNDDENSGKYAYTDDNREILPKEDVTKQITKLFGENVKPTFHTFTDSENSATYEFNKKSACFYIPMIAYNDYFTPNIRAVVKKNGTVKLTVDYISGQGWMQDSSGQVTPPAASKTMVYLLKGGRGRYSIVSVSDSSSSSSSALSSAPADSQDTSALPGAVSQTASQTSSQAASSAPVSGAASGSSGK